LIIAADFFFDGGSAIMGPYAAEAWPSTLRTSGMGSAYGFGGIGKIIGPIGLALIVGSSNIVKPDVTIAAIFPCFLYLGAWSALAGAVPRPALEVADIFRDHGAAWRRANAGHVSLEMSAIERCGTVALGDHVARCEDCANTVIAYNSCRNRHCPKCVRSPPPRSGSPSARPNCCPSAISTSCSPCRVRSLCGQRADRAVTKYCTLRPGVGVSIVASKSWCFVRVAAGGITTA
jgi:hypothetical protein